jgi:hypothetical protein
MIIMKKTVTTTTTTATTTTTTTRASLRYVQTQSNINNEAQAMRSHQQITPISHVKINTHRIYLTCNFNATSLSGTADKRPTAINQPCW